MSFFRRLKNLFSTTPHDSHATEASKLLAGNHPLAHPFWEGCVLGKVDPTYKQASKFLLGYGAAYQAWIKVVT